MIKKLIIIMLVIVQVYSQESFSSAIAAWCASIHLSESQLKDLATYFFHVKTWAEQCNNNSNYVNSPQGQALQEEIDNDVALIMQDPVLKDTYQKFTVIVKESLRPNNFMIIIQLYTEGLACIQTRSLELSHIFL